MHSITHIAASLVAIVLFFSVEGNAQTVVSTLSETRISADKAEEEKKAEEAKKAEEEKKAEEAKKAEETAFVDRNGDGINDGKEHRFRKADSRREKDRQRQLKKKKKAGNGLGK